MIFLIPAVLTTKQCHDYVGGSRLWEELITAHGDILRPVRTVPRGDSFWRRESVDGALRIAESAGSLISATGDTQPPILTKQARRFKPA